MRVLIVDDEPVNRLVLRTILETFGADVIEAIDGAQALCELQQTVCDVVLADIHMPNMGGIEMIRRLRSTPGPNQEIPAVAVTADTTRTRREYIEFGFDGYMNKPISIALVQSALDTTRTEVPPQGLSKAG